jgi:hypothetical protein
MTVDAAGSVLRLRAGEAYLDNNARIIGRRKILMICDVHAHYTPRNFSEFMGDRFASPVHLPVKRGMARHPFSDSPEDIEGRFKLMDEAGVEKQVLSPNHPPYLPDEAEGVKAVQMLNDGYADLAHRYPKRIS